MVSLASTPGAARASQPPTAMDSWRLGSLQVSLGAQPARALTAQEAVLLIPDGPCLGLRQESLAGLPQLPADLLYLPAGESRLRAARFDGWCLTLELQPLSLLAAELSEHRLSPVRFRRHLSRAQSLQLQLAPKRNLCATLRQLLQMGTSPALHQPELITLLELDRMIQRLVVLLLCGDLIDLARQRGGLKPEGRRQLFEELLLWIQAHLHQPIKIEDLVQQSGYSQRSLRSFFRERFGCGPVQWIRNQRLQLARERLLNPQPQDSVSAIAAALGYDHPSQFSRDFQQAFGSRPSTLLREGRRSQGLTGSLRSPVG